MLVQSLGQDDPLEEEMATRSSILAWKKHSCLENFISSLLWSHRELDTVEQAHTMA